MSEQNETNETSEDQDIKRWTAKRRAALVIELLRGQTTVAEAASSALMTTARTPLMMLRPEALTLVTR